MIGDCYKMGTRLRLKNKKMNLQLLQKHLGRIPNTIEQLFLKLIWNSITRQSQFDSELTQAKFKSNYNSKLMLVPEGNNDPRMIVAENIFLAENGKKLATVASKNGSFVIGLSSDVKLNHSNYGKHIYFLFGTGIKAIMTQLYKLDWFEGAIPVHKYGLGYSLYKLMKENKSGLRIPFEHRDNIHVLSKKGVQGVLININRRFDDSFNDLINGSKISYMDFGVITREPNLELLRDDKLVGHIPISILDILIRKDQHPEEIKLQTVVPSYRHPKFKEKKNYNGDLKRLVKKNDEVESIEFYRKTVETQGNIIFFKRGKSTYGATLNDNKHIDYNDFKMKSIVAIANTARQLTCAGIRPEICSGFIKIADSNQKEKGSFLNGIKEAGQILNLNINHLSLEANSILPDGTFCTVGTLISENIFPSTFQKPGQFISMLGSHRGELGGSRYLSMLKQESTGNRPVVDLEMESRLQDAILTGIRGGIIQSAKSVGQGGVAVSIADSFGDKINMGARIYFSRKLKTEELLFGETQGLVLVTIQENDLMDFERVCMTIGIPATTIGRVTNDGIYSFNDSIKLKVKDLN